VEEEFPLPAQATGLAGFVRALRDVKVWGGNPSLETLRRRTGVATSTLSDAFSQTRRRVPSLEIVRSIVIACGAQPVDVTAWERAWRALTEQLDAAMGPSAPELPSSAAESHGWTPRQLPSDVVGFSGRQEALETLHALPPVPATVITGTAGVGKTALAVHWAHRIADRFPDGQIYLDLRGHSGDPTITAGEAFPLLLQSLGVPVERIPADLQLQLGLYRSILSDRRVLVVLENVVDTAHVRSLLPSGAGCHALVTSRDALTGLVVREGAARVTLETLGADESIDLLTTHLGAARVAAEPGAAAELASLCAHLPLALRIVAANLAARPRHTIGDTVRELRATDLLGRLQVVGDPETAVAAAFDISYRALPAEAQRLFRLLGVVPGPEISREAAAVLLGRELTDSVPELDELTAAHLVAEEAPDRFRSHDLLSLYARSQAAGEPETVRAEALHRMLSWYVLSADDASRTVTPDRLLPDRPELKLTGRAHRFADAEDAADWIETELANFTAAVTHAAEHGPAPFAWHLVQSLTHFLYTRGNGVSQLAITRSALRAAEAADDASGRGVCHLSLGLASINLRHLAVAADEYEAAVEQFERAGDRRGVAAATGNLGDVYIRTGDIGRAMKLFEGNRTAGPTSKWIEAVNEGNLAMVKRIRGEYAEARRLATACRSYAQQMGNMLLAATAEVELAMTHLELGDPAAAEPLLLTALDAAEDGGSEVDKYDALAGLVLVCARAGRHDEAAVWAAAQSDLLARGVGSYSGDDWGHAAIIEAHLAAGRPGQALAVGVPALTEHDNVGYRLTAMRLRVLLGQAHAMLGDSATARELWEGALPYATEQNLPDRVRVEKLLA